MPATSYPPSEEHRKRRMLLMVTPEEKEQLRRMAKERGMSMSELVRRALFESNDREREPQK